MDLQPDVKLRHTFKGEQFSHWSSWFLSADGKLLAVAADPTALDLWDTTSGQRNRLTPLPKTKSIEEQVGMQP